MENARRIPDKIALIDNGEQVSYKSFCESVDYIEKELSEILTEKEPIGLFLNNSQEFIVCLIAAEKSHHTALLLGTGFKKNEIMYHMEKAHVRYLIGFEEKELFFIEMGAVLIKKIHSLCVFKFPIEINVAIYEKDDFICQLTSGSEGESKGIVRTKQQVWKEVTESIELTSLNEKEIFLTIPPLFHSYGLIIGALLPLSVGATVIFIKQFVASRIMSIVSKYQVTTLIMVPFMYDLICNAKNKNEFDFSSLKLCFSAGAILQEQTIRDFYNLSKLHISADYGSTETGVMCINMNPVKNFDSVGKCVGSRLIRIVDENGNEVKRNQIGSVITKSECNTKKYLYPERYNSRIKSEWIEIGDQGYMDEEGFVYIIGRDKNFINVGGEKVDPQEVENVLLQIPEVKEAVVVGKKADTYGEIVKAIIVKEGSINKIQISQYCLDKIAAYKIPKIIEFREEIPKSNTGKILKKYMIE
jgi:acyl-coA synthetases (AMP-forming)/AMP-acid ligases II